MASAIVDNIQLANLLTSTLSNLFGSPGTTQNVTTNAGNFSETRSGGNQTVTERLDISKEGIDALLRDLMEDDSTGFARVASGQKLAGLYNTTSRNMLLNDLLTRSAGQVAKLTAPKITTTTSTPQTTTRVSEPTTQTTTGGGKEGLLTLDNVGKTAGLLGLISLAGKGKDLLSTILGPTSASAAAIAQFPELAATSSAQEYLGGPRFLEELSSPIPGEETFVGPLPAADLSSFSTGADYMTDMWGNSLAGESVGEMAFIEDTAASAGLGPMEIGGDLAAEAAGTSLMQGLPIAFAVANADKIGEAYGSIGREVGDFIGGIFGMTGNEPWSQEAQDEWDRLYAPFVGSQQGGLG